MLRLQGKGVAQAEQKISKLIKKNQHFLTLIHKQTLIRTAKRVKLKTRKRSLSWSLPLWYKGQQWDSWTPNRSDIKRNPHPLDSEWLFLKHTHTHTKGFKKKNSMDNEWKETVNRYSKGYLPEFRGPQNLLSLYLMDSTTRYGYSTDNAGPNTTFKWWRIHSP